LAAIAVWARAPPLRVSMDWISVVDEHDRQIVQ